MGEEGIPNQASAAPAKDVKAPAKDEKAPAADKAKAHELAHKWIGEAQKVVEPTPAEIEKSAAMYLGMRAVLEKYQAQAITINCLGGFYGGRMEAYPCLGHFQLSSERLIGACEADL